jgi:hypothetical protein
MIFKLFTFFKHFLILQQIKCFKGMTVTPGHRVVVPCPLSHRVVFPFIVFLQCKFSYYGLIVLCNTYVSDEESPSEPIDKTTRKDQAKKGKETCNIIFTENCYRSV